MLFLAKHLKGGGLYPSYDMVSYIEERLTPEARIVALRNGTRYYVNRPYYDSGYFAGGLVHRSRDLAEVLKALDEGQITHVLINDVVVERYRKDPRGPFTGSWLVNRDFQDRHLTLIYCDGPQCLYELHDLEG